MAQQAQTHCPRREEEDGLRAVAFPGPQARRRGAAEEGRKGSRLPRRRRVRPRGSPEVQALSGAAEQEGGGGPARQGDAEAGEGGAGGELGGGEGVGKSAEGFPGVHGRDDRGERHKRLR